MRKRYPLEPLVTLRREKVDRRVDELGQAERQARSEREALAGARQRRTKAQERARAESETERARLEAGHGRVQDLARAELYRARERLRVEALGAVERKAERKVEGAERAVSDARGALGSARADARAIEQKKERFRRTGERAQLAAEEEAALDFHAVARRGRKV
jgi:flagellar biosynthesis chaperone FliJ